MIWPKWFIYIYTQILACIISAMCMFFNPSDGQETLWGESGGFHQSWNWMLPVLNRARVVPSRSSACGSAVSVDTPCSFSWRRIHPEPGHQYQRRAVKRAGGGFLSRTLLEREAPAHDGTSSPGLRDPFHSTPLDLHRLMCPPLPSFPETENLWRFQLLRILRTGFAPLLQAAGFQRWERPHRPGSHGLWKLQQVWSVRRGEWRPATFTQPRVSGCWRTLK